MSESKKPVESPSPMSLLPSVDRVLSSELAMPLARQYGQTAVKIKTRLALQTLRKNLQRGDHEEPSLERVLDLAKELLEREAAPSLRRVLNLTGTVLHTNLGRAYLPEEAINAVVDVARGGSNLEYDLEGGARGNRDSHLEEALLRLTGAEAAIVVNNNAAAIMLVLNTLALGQEVPVSRGELVEIGGSFRVPDIMSRSGCTLVEVGTTNRTHLRDFEGAIRSATALVMKVHASNYVIQGFTADVPEQELAELCRSRDLPFIVDLGAGSLVDLENYGLPHELTPAETLANGADLVTFSGDKLLGGPQAGIIVGRKDLVDRLRANPMKRALRCDKMTIAALAAVLQLYADPDRLSKTLPTLRALTRTVDEIGRTADALIEPLVRVFGSTAQVSVVDCDSVIGSGALPTRTLPSRAISIRPMEDQKGSGRALKQIASAFAALGTPIIGRIHSGAFMLDLRCLESRDEFGELLREMEGRG